MYLVWRTLEFLNNSSTVSSKIVKKKIRAPHKRYKDHFKSNLKDFNIDVTAWEKAATERPAWRRLISNGALLSEENRLNAAKLKCIRRWRRCTRETSHTLVPNMQKRFSGANRSDQSHKNTQIRAILSLFHLIYFYSFIQKFGERSTSTRQRCKPS